MLYALIGHVKTTRFTGGYYFEKGVLLKQFKSFYKEVGGNEGSKCNYPIRLDTYRMSVAATTVSIAMQNPY